MYKPKKIPYIPEGYHKPTGMMNRIRRDNFYSRLGLFSKVITGVILSALATSLLYRAFTKPVNEGTTPLSVRVDWDSLARAEDERWRAFHENLYNEQEGQYEEYERQNRGPIRPIEDILDFRKPF